TAAHVAGAANIRVIVCEPRATEPAHPSSESTTPSIAQTLHGASMRNMTIAVLVSAAAVAVSAQQESVTPYAGTEATALTNMSNLPVAKIGNDDLIGVTVYDAP